MTAPPTSHAAATPTELQERALIDGRRALIDLKNAVAENPEDAQLRYRLGSLYLQTGIFGAAEKELNRAISLGLPDFDARVKLAEAWIAQGRFQDVMLDQDLKAALDTPNAAAVYTLYGNAEMGRGQNTAARDAFQEALKLTPEYPPALLGSARLELEEGKQGAVELLLARLEQVDDPDLAAINELRGDLEMARGDFIDAESAYREALAAAPGRTDLMRDAAFAVMSSGQFDTARAELEQVIRLSPNDGNAKMMLAMAAFEQDDYTRAEELARDFTGTTDENPLPLYIAGASSYFIGNHEQAQEYLSRYVAQAPDDAAGRRVYAATLIALGKGQEAFDQLVPLAETADADAGLLSLLGNAAGLAGRADESVAYYEQAAALEPDNKELQLRLTQARLRTKDRAQGMTELEALVGDPSVQGARVRLLEERFQAHEFQQALDILETGDAEGGTDGKENILRARALLGSGQLDKAEALLGKILADEPNNLQAVAILAELLLKRGKPDEAIQAVQRIASDEGGAVAPQLLLSQVELRANRQTAATARLERLVQSHPNSMPARLTLAEAYIAEQRWQDAERLLDQAQDPEAFPVLMARSQLELSAERPNAATRTLRRALEQNPGSVEAHIQLARAARANGDLDAAAAAVETASGLAPEDPLVLFERARLALTDLAATEARLRQAGEDVATLRDRDGTSSDVAFLTGQIALRQGDNERGLALLLRAHEITRSSLSLLGYTDALWALGRRTQAMAELKGWIDRNPDDLSARLTRASYLLMASEYAAASEDLAWAQAAGADHQWLNATLAYALARSGDTQAAARPAQAALEADADDVLGLNAMGLVSLARGDARAAVESLAKAIEASDGRAPLALQLDYAEALKASGRIPEGQKLAAEILAKLSPNSPLRAQAEELAGR
jgi:putative PEP-CTERM system TPR-repeat lipoprotein